MAERGPSKKEIYDELLEKYGKGIADAYTKVVDDLKDFYDLQRALTALHKQRDDEFLHALHIEPEAYGPMLDQIGEAYGRSGQLAVSQLPPKDAADARLVVRFDARNPMAETWLRDHGANLVTRIVSDQREAIRFAMAAGLARGDNPTTTALDIVGRIDKASGKRVGGVVGLTLQQETFAQSALGELLSGDPAKLKNYLGRQARDRRFDPTVRKALKAAGPVDRAAADKMVGAYRNRLLKLRGDMIGRTESLTALRAAKHEAYRQAVEAGKIPESSVARSWRSAGDTHVRHTHQALNGQIVQGMRAAFLSPSGARLMFPGDTSQGAMASEIIGCRCDVEFKVDYLASLTPGPAAQVQGTQQALNEHAAGVTFEVAPDPNDAEATAAWNKLSPERKQEISQKVAEQLSPEALAAVGATGRLVFHTGGYQGATNPSMTLQVDDPAKAETVAKLLGHALSQDSMMVLSPEKLAHGSPSGVVDIAIGGADPAAVYDVLWKNVLVDGQPIVTGHTTMNGRMSILNDSDLSNEDFAIHLNEALGGRYEMTIRRANVGFIGKDEYDFTDAEIAAQYQGRATSALAGGPSLRQAADLLRQEATREIETLLAAPPRRGIRLPQVIPQGVLPNQFSATAYADSFNDPAVTPQKVLDQFPPEVAQKIRASLAKMDGLADTAALYRRADGSWADSRQALHSRILFEGQDELMFDEDTGKMVKRKAAPIFSKGAVEAAQPGSGQQPTLVMLGGRGGSGKSGLAGPAYDPNRAIVIDADAIKARLPEYRGWNAGQVHEESAAVFDMAVDFARSHGLNVVLDQTLKSTDKALASARQFSDAGYHVSLRYVFAPRQEAARRAIERSLTNYRLVTPEIVLKNTTNEASFEAVRKVADDWQFWDNQNTLRLVSAGVRGQ